MIRRLGVLVFCIGVCAAIGLQLPDWALLAIGILGMGVWYAMVRAERVRS